MLAPGKMPFDRLDLQPTAQLPNGDGDLSVTAAHEEHHGKCASRQSVKVPGWETFLPLIVTHLKQIPDVLLLSALPFIDPLLHPPQH